MSCTTTATECDSRLARMRRRRGGSLRPALVVLGHAIEFLRQEQPMTKKDFTTTARPVNVTIAGQTLQAVPKAFATGSVGFRLNGKVTVQLPNGETAKLQVNGNLVIVG